MKGTFLALTMAACLSAAQASADIVHVTMDGTFSQVTGPTGWYKGPTSSGTGDGVNPILGSGGGLDAVEFNYQGTVPHPAWSLDFTFDSSLGTLTPTADMISWKQADGGASPLIAATFYFPYSGFQLDLSNAASFFFARGNDSYYVDFRVPSGYLQLPAKDPLAPTSVTENASGGGFSFYIRPFDAGGYSSYFSTTLHYKIENLGPSPTVPEPTTWAMLIIGLGATGAALRRRQALRRRTA